MSRWRYRLAQGLRALYAPLTQPDLSDARALLTECELAAFAVMSRADQRHSLRVLGAVAQGNQQADKVLRKAALLHDIGKSRHPLAVWQKTLAVLGRRLAPVWSRQAAAKQQLSSLYAPFAVGWHHARWGGDILRACETEAAVIWLVENHQEHAEGLRDHPLYGLLVALQGADNRS